MIWSLRVEWLPTNLLDMYSVLYVFLAKQHGVLQGLRTWLVVRAVINTNTGRANNGPFCECWELYLLHGKCPGRSVMAKGSVTLLWRNKVSLLATVQSSFLFSMDVGIQKLCEAPVCAHANKELVIEQPWRNWMMCTLGTIEWYALGY